MTYTKNLSSIFNLLRSKKKLCKECLIVASAMIFVFAMQYLIIQVYSNSGETTVNTTGPDFSHVFSVSYIIDGSPFVYLDSGKNDTVRVLGVDTPDYSVSIKQDFVNMENQARMSKKGLLDLDTCPVL